MLTQLASAAISSLTLEQLCSVNEDKSIVTDLLALCNMQWPAAQLTGTPGCQCRPAQPVSSRRAISLNSSLRACSKTHNNTDPGRGKYEATDPVAEVLFLNTVVP